MNLKRFSVTFFRPNADNKKKDSKRSRNFDLGVGAVTEPDQLSQENQYKSFPENQEARAVFVTHREVPFA